MSGVTVAVSAVTSYEVAISKQTGTQKTISTTNKDNQNNGSKMPKVEEYDVAFSLAHEQHEYVDDVFSELKKLLPKLKIFYYRDDQQEINMWGKNMFPHLKEIYRDHSKYVIIFISKDYIAKKWAKHEWLSIQEAIIDREDEYLLPARLDDSILQGLHSTISYVDISNKAPDAFAKMIADKVNKN